MRTKRLPTGNASLVGIAGHRRLTLIEGLADGLREEHDEAAEPKPTFAGLSPERAENGRISRVAFTGVLACEFSSERITLLVQ